MKQISTDTLLRTDLSKRVYGLDILRAFAILTVVVLHGAEYVSDNLKFIFHVFVFDGVSVFFVLSGFLIGTILIKTFVEKEITFRHMVQFWMNRWLRTIPPYYFVLTLLIVLTPLLGSDLDPWFLGKKKVLSYYLFFQNFSWTHWGFFAESWSLAVEEWFYLLTPAILIIIHKVFKINLKYSFVIVILIMLAFPTCVRLYRYIIHLDMYALENLRPLDMYFRKQVVTRLDSIMFGVLGAYVAFFHKKFWEKTRYGFYFIRHNIHYTYLLLE